ncbi:MAG TPA: gfo/Idh/MocA family oxidoreductase [Phycisphaerae bacterium]|nr:gfo/Idh/MocA family oxidoreductase [Phycisphaerae bacterium]HRY67288.1 gfo/Idh/MocA family oxidoreductase [Phycisphaerae bacterium]HSA26342.1 gfo/Idh/MocA family oxidoreductase [Phycisphaerae bacterium]
MADVIRIGMIGCDTSHCGVFAGLFGDEKAPEDLRGLRVVAAYPSFSPDLKSSVGRVEGYKKQLAEKHGVKMVGSIEDLVGQVDGVMIESVDGRRHLKELEPVAAAGKPCFIDKPFAASLTDAKEAVRIIKAANLPCWSGSSLRFDSAMVGFLEEQAEKRAKAASQPAGKDARKGEVLGCDAYSPAEQEPTNPGFFWYGIHGVEILYTLMGRGCRKVQCSTTPDADLAVGVWQDGRIGSMRGIRRGPYSLGATVLHSEGFTCLPSKGDYYKGLGRQLVKFFKTRQAPVPIEETLEICAFIDAALRSGQQGGCDVEIDL